MRIVCNNHPVVSRPNIKATRSARWQRKADRRLSHGIIIEQLEAMQAPQLTPQEQRAEDARQLELEIGYDNPWADEDACFDDYIVDPIILTATPEEIRASERIEVLNICAIIDLIFGVDSWTRRISFAVRDAAVRAWGEENDCAMYSAGREQFSDLAARLTAIKAGKSKVIAEDLS